VPLHFAYNFAKCWPIFKILSPTDIAVNVWQSNKTKHPTTYSTRRYYRPTLWNVCAQKSLCSRPEGSANSELPCKNQLFEANGATSSDLEWPLTTTNHPIFDILYRLSPHAPLTTSCCYISDNLHKMQFQWKSYQLVQPSPIACAATIGCSSWG